MLRRRRDAGPRLDVTDDHQPEAIREVGKRPVISDHLRALVRRHLRKPSLHRGVEPGAEVGESLLERRTVVRTELRKFLRHRLRHPLAVVRIQPVMGVALWMHIAHRAGDLPGRYHEDLRGKRCVQIALGAGLDVRIAALLNQRRQPANFQFAADRNYHVGLLKLEDEARLRLDEMRILVAPRERFDGDPIATDLTSDRREIFSRGDDVQFGLRKRRRRPQNDCKKKEPFPHKSPQNGRAL